MDGSTVRRKRIGINGLGRFSHSRGDVSGRIDRDPPIFRQTERVKGELSEHQYMHVKVRNRKVQNQRIVQPFSVYMYFLKPSNVKGQQALYVEGQNNNKLVAKAGGRLGAFTPSVRIDPNGLIAMKGQRYPIAEAGIEKLAEKLIERGLRDRKLVQDCKVAFQSREWLFEGPFSFDQVDSSRF